MMPEVKFHAKDSYRMEHNTIRSVASPPTFRRKALLCDRVEEYTEEEPVSKRFETDMARFDET
jgi:hypothetical protein